MGCVWYRLSGYGFTFHLPVQVRVKMFYTHARMHTHTHTPGALPLRSHMYLYACLSVMQLCHSACYCLNSIIHRTRATQCSCLLHMLATMVHIYVWIRSNHERTIHFTSEDRVEKDYPLQLKSTLNWHQGGKNGSVELPFTNLCSFIASCRM